MRNDPSITRRQLIAGSVAGAAAMAAADPALATPQAPAQHALPLGTLGKASISRVLLGGNLISGFVHSRDLRYVAQLFHAYATTEKILETLALAERNGINTVFETGGEFVQRYNKERGGHMQFIPHIEISPDQSDSALRDHIKRQVDTGGVALYTWGVASDVLVRAGQGAKLAKAVEMAKAYGLPVGVGSHSLSVPKECERLKAPVDFYVKTLHRDNYPSATPKERRKDYMWLTGEGGFYDNIWCIDADETVAFMKSVAKPWIAFKILAAGAIPPADGFSYAFSSGADFVAVGMFDFQIKENCEIARRVLEENRQRPRPWRA
jgi:hypothetical protein